MSWRNHPVHKKLTWAHASRRNAVATINLENVVFVETREGTKVVHVKELTQGEQEYLKELQYPRLRA